MTRDRTATSGAKVRLAYLCNLYPAVSHSFVRREIEGVENAGHSVVRFTVRPPASNLRDEADLREAEQTETVLGKGFGRLLLSVMAMALSHPLKTLAAATAAYRLSGPGMKAKARHFAYWLEAAWLVRRLDKLAIDHLHVHFGTNPTAVAVIARAWGGPPFSFTAHGPDEFDAPIELSLRAKIEAASFVVAISSYGRSQLMRWCKPEKWNKIQLIRCGVDAGFLNAKAEEVSPNSTEFVCIARLSGQKGLPLLIGACAQLRKRQTLFSLTIIGDGDLRQTIDAEIRKHDLCEIVKLTGAQSSDEIRTHLCRARALVLPSFAEGLPVVLMEALALGRPVIATMIAGIPELVDASCGWPIPAGSQQALVQAMDMALRASANELSALGRAGRYRVQAMHDSEKNGREIASIFAQRQPG